MSSYANEHCWPNTYDEYTMYFNKTLLRYSLPQENLSSASFQEAICTFAVSVGVYQTLARFKQHITIQKGGRTATTALIPITKPVNIECVF